MVPVSFDLSKILTLYETQIPYCLDPFTLETLGPEDLNGTLSLKNAAAHFRIDPVTMVSFILC